LVRNIDPIRQPLYNMSTIVFADRQLFAFQLFKWLTRVYSCLVSEMGRRIIVSVCNSLSYIIMHKREAQGTSLSASHSSHCRYCAFT